MSSLPLILLSGPDMFHGTESFRLDTCPGHCLLLFQEEERKRCHISDTCGYFRLAIILIEKHMNQWLAPIRIFSLHALTKKERTRYMYGKISLLRSSFSQKMSSVAVVQLLSLVQLLVTSWTTALPGSSVLHYLLSLLKFISAELVVLSNHPILWRGKSLATRLWLPCFT